MKICGSSLKVISVERPISESNKLLFHQLEDSYPFEQVKNYQKWLNYGQNIS